MTQYLNRLFITTLFVMTFSIGAVGFSSLAQADSLNSDNEPDKYVSVSAFANKTQVTGGETIRLGLQQIIYPKWHTYWENPGDSGLPFSVNWELPEGFTASAIEFTTPQKIPFDELTNYGYEGEVVLLQNLTLPANLPSGEITLNGMANLLVCHDICIPESHPVTLTLNGEQAGQPDIIKSAEEKLPTILNLDASYSVNGQQVEVTIENTDIDLMFDNAYIAPVTWGLVNNSGVLSLEKTSSGYKLTQSRGERDLSEIENFDFIITGPNADKAYRISAKPDPKQAAIIPAAPSSTTPVVESPTQATPTLNLNFGSAILFALIGGLILNLMPCVFPVLSMKALSLVKLGDQEQKKAQLYGLSYTAGILISFLIIAATLIILKSAGAQIGWGFQLQNPIVISLLIYLIFTLGLNLSGFFEISAGFTNIGSKLATQSGNKGAFFTGVLATIVATPCTAPFMGAAMGYALTQPAYVSLIVFMALGLGLAIPYLALCFIPALRTRLPKPGAWMENFRQILSFPMFLTAAFLVWVLSQQTGHVSVLLILVSMVAITFAIWLYQHRPNRGLLKSVNTLFLLGAFAVIIITPIGLKTMTAEAVVLENSEIAFNDESLAKALATDKPVFTNMTAAWCITCKVNERVALKTDTVQAVFAAQNIQYLKGDWTNSDPTITRYLNSFDRQGVPLYVYYPAPDNQTGQRPEPIILPQILTAGLVLNVIEK